MYLMLVVFFFFFQAEDGIRDGTVTGVQTCALPICSSYGAILSPSSAWANSRATARTCRCSGVSSKSTSDRGADVLADEADDVLRSEERRVGKECRSGWSACLSKDKTDRNRERGHTT